MSGYVTGWVLKHAEVQGSARLVLIVLADHASSDGTNAWPSVETIQHEARLGARSTVQRALRQLEEQGAIRKAGTAGRGQANWTVVMEGPQDAAGRVVQPPGAASDAEGGPHGAAQTVLNRPEEPSSAPARENVPSPVLSVAASETLKVWLHYVEVMEPRHPDLDPESARLIREALKVATADECKGAISGCRASAFHMGENDRRKKYNRLSQILKGKRGVRTLREQIDLFLDIAEKAGVGHSDLSVDPARLREAKRSVLTAWEFPNSEQAQKAGDMSAAWLAQHGYTVERDLVTGRPTFILRGGA